MIAAIVWVVIYAQRGSLIASCVVYLIAACCFSGDFWSLDAGGLTWSADRLFLVLVCAAFAVQSWQGRTEPKRLSWADGGLACFLAVLLISTFTHDWRAAGSGNDSVLMHLVNGYAIPAVIFGIAKHARLTRESLCGAYALLAAFGVYLAVTAVCEITGQWACVFPSYIADPKLGIHFGRARGPMLQSARLGAYLIVCGAATLGLMTYARGRWKLALKGLAAMVAPVYATAMYATYTRSVWLGAGMGAVLALTLTLRGRWRAVVLASALAIAAGFVAVKREKLIAFERGSSAAETRESTYMRASFAYVSWKMFQDKPLTGFGFGQFRENSKHYLGDRTTSLHLEHIRGYIHHNTLLSLLVELGIFGLLLFVAFLAEWLGSAWLLWRDGSAPLWMRTHGLLFLVAMEVYTLQMLFREVSYSPVENALLFFLAGTVCSLRSRQSAVGSPGGSAVGSAVGSRQWAVGS
jgi:O-antigen ligase